jgi:hypothetical protein
MKKWFTCFVSLCVLIVGAISPVYAEKTSAEAFLYPELKQIEQFCIISVTFIGSVKESENLDLSKSDLINYAKLRYKNNFAGIPYNEKELGDIKPQDGMMFIRVWTVGEESIIAYHTEITISTRKEIGIYEDSYLGYTYTGDLKASIKDCISGLMEDFATTFFKARGEL